MSLPSCPSSAAEKGAKEADKVARSQGGRWPSVPPRAGAGPPVAHERCVSPASAVVHTLLSCDIL